MALARRAVRPARVLRISATPPNSSLEAAMTLALSWVAFRGNSMWPTFKPGDILLISQDVGSLSEGDVVVVYVADELVAHRVVWVDDKWFLKGDSAPHVHEMGQPLARVVGFRRKNHEVYWGPDGQEFKKYLSRSSVHSHLVRGWRRALYRVLIHLLNFAGSCASSLNRQIPVS